MPTPNQSPAPEHAPLPMSHDEARELCYMLAGGRSDTTLHKLRAYIAAAEEKETLIHPWYGPCDGLAPNDSCSECLRLKEAKESGDDMVKRLRAERDKLKAAVFSATDALEKIVDMNRQHAHDQYGDAEKAELWACVTIARACLRALKPE